MDDKQTNQLGQAEKVVTFLTDHAKELTPTPEVISKLLPELQANIQETLDNDALATQDNTGHTEDKGDDRVNLEDAVFHVSTGLVSYADDTDDFVLQNMIEFPISTIQGFRDMRLAQYAETILDKVTNPTVAAALADKHNVVADDITELQTLATNFKSKIATPLEKRAEAVAYGKLVDRNLAAVKQTLEKIRRKMKTYRKTNRLLFDMFEAVDVTDDYGQGGSSSNTISGTVGMGETKQAIPLDTYTATQAITLNNKGTVALIFIAYLQGTAVGTSITVAPGISIKTRLGTLASNADAIFVQNTNTTVVGSYSVSLS
jgi:hypothetical protein